VSPHPSPDIGIENVFFRGMNLVISACANANPEDAPGLALYHDVLSAMSPRRRNNGVVPAIERIAKRGRSDSALQRAIRGPTYSRVQLLIRTVVSNTYFAVARGHKTEPS
jgi:hypothetical protein